MEGPIVAKTSLPRLDQRSSRLLLLPAEILFKILRYTLRAGEPIRSVEERELIDGQTWKDALKATEQSIELSAQLLSCCQQLYLEGYHILYNENTLRLFYDGYSCGYYYWDPMHVLNQRYFFLNGFGDVMAEMKDKSTARVLDWAVPPEGCEDDDDDDDDEYTGATRVLSIVTRMKHLDLIIYTADEDDLHTLAFQLQSWVQGKELRIEQLYYNDSYAELTVDSFKPCRWFRCSSLSIVCDVETEAEKTLLTEIKAVAEGHEPYGECISAWGELRELCYKHEWDGNWDIMDALDVYGRAVLRLDDTRSAYESVVYQMEQAAAREIRAAEVSLENAKQAARELQIKYRGDAPNI